MSLLHNNTQTQLHVYSQRYLFALFCVEVQHDLSKSFIYTCFCGHEVNFLVSKKYCYFHVQCTCTNVHMHVYVHLALDPLLMYEKAVEREEGFEKALDLFPSSFDAKTVQPEFSGWWACCGGCGYL